MSFSRSCDLPGIFRLLVEALRFVVGMRLSELLATLGRTLRIRLALSGVNPY